MNLANEQTYYAYSVYVRTYGLGLRSHKAYAVITETVEQHGEWWVGELTTGGMLVWKGAKNGSTIRETWKYVASRHLLEDSLRYDRLYFWAHVHHADSFMDVVKVGLKLEAPDAEILMCKTEPIDGGVKVLMEITATAQSMGDVQAAIQQIINSYAIDGAITVAGEADQEVGASCT